jgi:hypothetical protein
MHKRKLQQGTIHDTLEVKKLVSDVIKTTPSANMGVLVQNSPFFSLCNHVLQYKDKEHG